MDPGIRTNSCQVCKERRHWRSCHGDCSHRAFVVYRWCGVFFEIFYEMHKSSWRHQKSFVCMPCWVAISLKQRLCSWWATIRTTHALCAKMNRLKLRKALNTLALKFSQIVDGMINIVSVAYLRQKKEHLMYSRWNAVLEKVNVQSPKNKFNTFMTPMLLYLLSST